MWMGYIYDQTQSFYWALFPLVVLYLAAAVGYWFLPYPKLPQRLQAQRDREVAREAGRLAVEPASPDN